ncbi:hypothetical protein D3C78_989240 [compost metagenome]
MHPRQHCRGGLPEQIEFGGDAEHLVGIGIGPVAEGVGHQRDRDTGLACLLAQQQGMAGITACLEHHQRAVFRAPEQHLAEVPGTAIDHLDAVAQVVQQVGHALGHTTLGLKTGNEYPRPVCQALGGYVPGLAAAVFVHPYQRGNFQLKAACAGVVVVLLAVFLQAVSHQPWAITQVALKVLLERLEMGITE